MQTQRAIGLAATFALVIAASGVARADGGVVCVKVKHFLGAIDSYQKPYTADELAQLDGYDRQAAQEGRVQRFDIPELFEITLTVAPPRNASVRELVQLRVRPQGFSRGFSISSHSILVDVGDVARGCPDDPTAVCNGESISFVGDQAAASLWFVGLRTRERVPSLTIEGAVLCTGTERFVEDEDAVVRMKAYLKGPRIP